MENNIYTEYQKLIDKMIALNLRARKQLEPLKNTVSPIYWAKQMCTVKICIGRQMGSTDYIKKHATKTDIVIVQTRQQVKDYMTIEDFHRLEIRVVTVDEVIKSDRLRSLLIDNVYIDNASSISDTDYYQLYSTIVRGIPSERTFILLG